MSGGRSATAGRLFPPGFRALSAAAGLLLALGLAQLVALGFRDEHHPVAAALLALLLLAGGAVLAAFVGRNLGSPAAPEPRSASDLLTALSAALIAGEALWVLGETGIFFPLRMALLWRGPLPAARLAEPVLPMMLAGSCLLGLGALATAALAGGLWLLLYARGLRGPSRAAGALLSFLGAVPYAGFALVVRALLCAPTAFLAAGRLLALRPDERLAWRSLLASAPGLLAASVALGLPLGCGLWSWLEQVRATEEASDSFLAAALRGERPWAILVRQGLWLRRRRDLGALLLGGMAATVLIDILSNTLIDSFRPPGFPPYPSLGSALFLRGTGDDGAPAPLPPGWLGAWLTVVPAALLLLLAQTLPRRSGRASLEDGALGVGGHRLATGVDSAHGLAPRPALQWVLGASGSGKTTLLRAWAAQLARAAVVPQDPDEALPGALSALDLGLLARGARPRSDRVLWDLLGRLDDGRLQRRLLDPFTPASSLSRGERQRLLACMALARAHADPDCALLLDEPGSAQDASRTRALFACLRELLPGRPGGTGSLVITSHDPEALEALLGGGGARQAPDHLLWLEQGRAHRFTVLAGRLEGGPQPPGLRACLDAVGELLDARDRASSSSARPLRGGVRPLPAAVSIGGRMHSISPQAQIGGGELVVLSGPSGCGKTTLLRAIARGRPAAVAVGYLAQDPSRAFPGETPVREVLGAHLRPEALRRWCGPGPADALLSRPLGALSEGERQRVLLAGEVLRLEESGAPLRLLLLDEPFAALDPAAHLRSMRALLEWLGEAPGRAAILISHSPRVDLGLAGASGVPTAEWTIDGGAR